MSGEMLQKIVLDLVIITFTPSKKGYQENIFSYFCIKRYVVILIRSASEYPHVFFPAEIRKIMCGYSLLSEAMLAGNKIALNKVLFIQPE